MYTLCPGNRQHQIHTCFDQLLILMQIWCCTWWQHVPPRKQLFKVPKIILLPPAQLIVVCTVWFVATVIACFVRTSSVVESSSDSSLCLSRSSAAIRAIVVEVRIIIEGLIIVEIRRLSCIWWHSGAAGTSTLEDGWAALKEDSNATWGALMTFVLPPPMTVVPLELFLLVASVRRLSSTAARRSNHGFATMRIQDF